MTFVWTDEAVERLKTLHSQGLSGAELAARLGCGLTRSAIFGKLHRLGLTGMRSPATQIQRSRLAASGVARGVAGSVAARGFAERGFASGIAAGRTAPCSPGGNKYPPPRFNFMRKARFAVHGLPAYGVAASGVATSGVAASAPAAVSPLGASPPASVGPLPPPSRNIGIVDIGRFQCRFIAGDDGLACGHPTVNGSSWCPAHHAIVFAREEA